MDGLQLRDEAVRDRIRAAEEFLDPNDPRARSYRADILLMLNRGLRRLTVRSIRHVLLRQCAHEEFRLAWTKYDHTVGNWQMGMSISIAVARGNFTDPWGQHS